MSWGLQVKTCHFKEPQSSAVPEHLAFGFTQLCYVMSTHSLPYRHKSLILLVPTWTSLPTAVKERNVSLWKEHLGNSRICISWKFKWQSCWDAVIFGERFGEPQAQFQKPFICILNQDYTWSLLLKSIFSWRVKLTAVYFLKTKNQRLTTEPWYNIIPPIK